MSAPGGGDFRGVGWAWPVLPEREGAIATAREDESIRESILLILGTARGERVMRPDFGCGIHDLVFAPGDSTTAARVSWEVRNALIDFEPRIDVLDVRVSVDGAQRTRLLVELEYEVRSTNTVFNLVYPFYLQATEA